MLINIKNIVSINAVRQGEHISDYEYFPQDNTIVSKSILLSHYKSNCNTNNKKPLDEISIIKLDDTNMLVVDSKLFEKPHLKISDINGEAHFKHFENTDMLEDFLSKNSVLLSDFLEI